MDALLRRQLRRQLLAAEKSGLRAELTEAASIKGLPVAWVLAIASRETGMRNILGDGGHGVGVMQIDIRYHQEAARHKLDGSWALPSGRRELISYGCHLLRSLHSWAKQRFPEWGGFEGEGWIKIASAAYNSGSSRVATAAAEGDADRYTTGRNYGRDVVQRMKILRGLL